MATVNFSLSVPTELVIHLSIHRFFQHFINPESTLINLVLCGIYVFLTTKRFYNFAAKNSIPGMGAKSTSITQGGADLKKIRPPP